jgi:hypothetical protein
MLAPSSGRAARLPWLPTPSPLRLAALAVCLPLLAACAAPPALEPAAASADSPARPVAYNPVLRGCAAQRPTEPKAWRERNDSVAPQEKGQ